jgi:hypothetical protein
MTTLGKTLFAVAAVGVLVSVGLSLHPAPKPAPAVQLSPEQRAELFHAPAPPPQPKVIPAIHYEPPTPGLTPEDGDGS